MTCFGRLFDSVSWINFGELCSSNPQLNEYDLLFHCSLRLKFIPGSCVQDKYSSFPFHAHSYLQCSQYCWNEKRGNWNSIEDWGTLMGINYTFWLDLCWWSVSLEIGRWTIMPLDLLPIISHNRCLLCSVIKLLRDCSLNYCQTLHWVITL